MGFIHGESFMIASAFDGLALDVKKGKRSNGTKVVGWNWNNEANQIWTSSSESGGFRLQAAHVTDDIRVMDQEQGSSRVIIWQFNGGDNQLWNAFPVSSNPGTFFIQNVGSGMALRNMGRGNVMEAVHFNEHDPNTHWRITPLNSM